MLSLSTLCKRRLAPSICFVADTLHLQRNIQEREQTECPNTGSFDPNDTTDISEVLVAYMSPLFVNAGWEKKTVTGWVAVTKTTAKPTHPPLLRGEHGEIK